MGKILSGLTTMMGSSRQLRRSLAVVLATGGVLCAFAAFEHLLTNSALAAPAVTGQVYMPDSAAATERFTLARNLEKAADWDKAADVYQELLEKYPDKVVAPGAAGASQYVSVRRLAQQLLCKWPVDALAVYRGKYGPAANAMLASADRNSPADLSAIARRYLLTDAGTSASLQLLDRYWATGRLVEAARWGKTLLELHPSIEPQRPAVCFEVAMACHLSGDDVVATTLLKDLQTRYPEAVGNVAGRDVTLATELAAQLKIPTTSTTRSLDAWPMFGGSADRSGITASTARVDARLYSVDFSQSSADATVAVQPGMPPGMPGMMPIPGGIPGSAFNQAAGIMPVADHGELFAADGKRLYGISIDSGMKLPGWPATSVPLPEETVPRGMRTVTVTEHSVLTVVGASSLGRFLRGDDASSGLRCVDRVTGATRWTFRASTLPLALRNIQLVSSVLAADGSVYVAAHGGKGGQIDDAYLLCLDESNGNCRWATYIASGPTTVAGFDSDLPFLMEPMTPQFSLSAGRLIVSTNLGVIAALDIADGAIAWMTPYERPITAAVQPWQAARWMQRRNPGASFSGWAASPPIVVEGQVFVLPSDGTAILTLDAETGELRKSLPRKAVDDADLLLAVDHGEMILSSDHSAWCLDAGTLDATGKNLVSATLWNMRFGGATLRGRPFLTTECLYIPTSERIFRVGRSKWKIADVYPAYGQPWPKDEGPGNILVTADHVAIATAARLNIYASLASATAKLDKAIQADPASPEPLLRYAELLVAAHQAQPALAKLKAAIPLTSGSTATAERAFNLALNAWKQLAASDNAEDAAIAPGFFESAMACARLPRHRAQLWIAAGDWAAGRQQWPQAIDAYQQILADREARDLLLTAANGTSSPAWQRSYASLKRILDAKGRSLYGKYDQLASAALQKPPANGVNKADALLEVGEQFPNSTSAPAALLQGARLLEEAKQYRRSADALRRLYQLQPAGELTPQAIEAMARVYCAIPHRSVVAASRLALGAETLKNPRLAGEIHVSSGQVISNVTFAEAAAIIRKQAKERDREPMPDFALPATAGQDAFKPATTWPNIDGLIPANDGAERDDRLVARTSAGEVIVIEAGKPDPLLRMKLTDNQPEHYFWIDQSLVIWSDNELTAVEPPRAAPQWKLALASLPQAAQPVELPAEAAAPAIPAAAPKAAPDTDMEIAQDASAPVLPPQVFRNISEGDHETIAECDGNSAQVVFATSAGRIAAVDAATGRLTWQTHLGGCVAQRVLCGEEFTAVRFSDASPLQLAAFDNATGQVVFRVARGPAGQVQNFDLADDGRLVFTFPDRLCAKDLFESGEALAFEVRIPQHNTPFVDMIMPLQLQTTADRILAITDAGTLLRAFSLQTGKPMPIPTRDGPPGDAVATGSKGPGNAGTMMLIDDPYTYLISDSTLAVYNLERAESPWRRLPSDATRLAYIAVGRDHLLTFDEPRPPAPFGPPGRPAARPNNPDTHPTKMRVLAFSRAQGKEGESGRLEQIYQFNEPSGIVDVTAINGGIYYVTGAHELRYLAGAGTPTTRP